MELHLRLVGFVLVFGALGCRAAQPPPSPPDAAAAPPAHAPAAPTDEQACAARIEALRALPALPGAPEFDR
jgi:hypothetical protein